MAGSEPYFPLAILGDDPSSKPKAGVRLDKHLISANATFCSGNTPLLEKL